MKALSFEIDGRASFGIVAADGVYEASDSFRRKYVGLRDVLEAEALRKLEENVTPVALDDARIRFLPTIPNPRKVICVGMNYRPHAVEMQRQLPKKPALFVRFPDSQTGHRRALIKSRVSQQYDYEGELGLIIGKRARHVPRNAASQVIAGYTCFMDGSVRDWQRHTGQFTAGKNFHRSGAMGPYLLTAESISDPAELHLTTRVNGDIVQDACVGELIFDIPALIEYCSTFAELLPGDVIATGTPGGVGAARNPPKWLKPGDRVEVDIGPVGRLENTVREEAGLVSGVA